MCVQPPPAPAATGRAAELPGLLTLGNRRGAGGATQPRRHRRPCQGRAGVLRFAPREESAFCSAKTQPRRPVADERHRPPAPGQTGIGRNTGMRQTHQPQCRGGGGDMPGMEHVATWGFATPPVLPKQ